MALHYVQWFNLLDRGNLSSLWQADSSNLKARKVVAVHEKKVTRNTVIKTLVHAFQPLDYAHALYEGGAIAFNRLDEWSDIDLYLVVDNDKVDEAFHDAEKALKTLSLIKQKYEVKQLPWPGVSQAFYKLEGASEYLLIDFAVLKLSGPEKFLEPEIHGKPVFYFNKSNKIKAVALDRDSVNKSLQERFVRLRDRFTMFSIFVQKEINRGNFIEALGLYYSLALGSVVDALRIKYSPFHHDFKTRYIRYELPSEIVEKLGRLYFVRDEKDLERKYREATKWFKEIVAKP